MPDVKYEIIKKIGLLSKAGGQRRDAIERRIASIESY